MRAREFLVQRTGEGAFVLRHLIKEPLTADELRVLSKKLGGPKELVAPKRRAEAGQLDGEKLIAWLAEDGARVRRPIIVTAKKVTLGFTKTTPDELAGAL
jgi:arsenate reductase-like glutaredoxin family protein